jgi:hypothetical protein
MSNKGLAKKLTQKKRIQPPKYDKNHPSSSFSGTVLEIMGFQRLFIFHKN